MAVTINNLSVSAAQASAIRAALEVGSAVPGTANGAALLNSSGKVPDTAIGTNIPRIGPVIEVSGLAAAAVGSTAADLTWTTTSGAVSYLVDWRIYNNTNLGTYGTAVAVSGTSYRVTGLSAGVTYQFRVKGVFGTSGNSTGTTTTIVMPDVAVTLAAPTSLRLSAVTTTTATLDWNPVTGATAYKVWFRLTNGGTYNATPNATQAGVQYVAASLTANTAYTVRVVGSNGTTDGPATELAITTPAGAIADPSGLTVTMSSSGASLSWTAGSGAASYLVDWQVTGTSYGLPIDVTTTTAAVTGLTPGVGYTFRVRSKSGTTLSTGVTTTGTTTGTATGGGTTADVWSGGSGTGASLSVTKPAATAGQRYLLWVTRKSKATAATLPSGFTALMTQTNATSAGETILYEKVSAGEASGTITLTYAASVDAAWVLLLTSKARTVAPTGAQNGFQTSFSAPSITATTANSTLVNVVATSTWPRTFGLPGGVTAQGGSPFSAANGPSILAATATVAAGATTAYAYTPIDPYTNVTTGDENQAISVVLDGTAATGGGGSTGALVSTLAATVPAANSGDTRFLAAAWKDATTRTIATPSGWTQAGTVATSVGRLTVWYQVLAADIAAGTQTLTITGGTADIATYSWAGRGAFRVAATSSGGFSTTVTVPTATATTANSTQFQIAASAQFPRTFTQPGGVTLLGQQQADNGPSLAAGFRTVAAGATGTSAWTLDVGDIWLSMNIILDAASGGGGSGSGNIFYLGSHQHGNADNTDRFAAGYFPSSTNTMEPFNFGAIRSHDCEAVVLLPWWTGRTGGIGGAGPNIYDWTLLDRWTDKVVGRGHKLLMCFAMCPNWASRLPSQGSVYGPGATSGPANWTAWRSMVADTVSRIQTRHGASALIAVEPCNEPVGGDNLITGSFLDATNYAPGVTDQVARLTADMTKYTYLGVRDVSATLPVLVGAHTWQDEANTRRLMSARTSANEPITSFGTAWSFHPYGLYDGNGLSPSLTAITASMRALATEYGTASWPFWATEVGLYYPWEPQKAAWWNGLSTADRAFHLQQWCAAYKSLGYVAMFTYSVDGTTNGTGLSFLGYPEVNSVIRTAMNTAFAALNKES
jgi:hypothetical protein